MQLTGYDSDSVNYEVPKKGMSRLEKLYKRDKGICKLCFKPCLMDDATVDHVIPQSKGGFDKPKNTKLAHRYCNQLKGDTV